MTQEQYNTIFDALDFARRYSYGSSIEDKCNEAISVLNSLPVDEPVKAGNVVDKWRKIVDDRMLFDDLFTGTYELRVPVESAMQMIADYRKRIREETRREAIFELATKIADWPMKYDGPSPDQGEAESYYEIMKYCYSLIGREWK